MPTPRPPRLEAFSSDDDDQEVWDELCARIVVRQRYESLYNRGRSFQHAEARAWLAYREKVHNLLLLQTAPRLPIHVLTTVQCAEDVTYWTTEAVTVDM